MSLPPITLPDLDSAGPIDPDNDLMLIRQGLNDRKINAGLVQNIRLSGLSLLPGQIVASDVLLVGRDNGAGYDNFLVPPQYLGFLNGVNMWFYQATAPLGWTVIPSSGDRLLAISDLATQVSPAQYNGVFAPALTGQWQQLNHILTINQIPAHTHGAGQARPDSGTLSLRSGSGSPTITTFQTASVGGGEGHNHGNIWRPQAAVGILCTKNKQVGQ